MLCHGILFKKKTLKIKKNGQHYNVYIFVDKQCVGMKTISFSLLNFVICLSIMGKRGKKNNNKAMLFFALVGFLSLLGERGETKEEESERGHGTNISPMRGQYNHRLLCTFVVKVDSVRYLELTL